TKHSRRAKNSSSRIRTTFSTPVTPTRESPTGTLGGRAWTSSPAPCGGSSGGGSRVACTTAKPSAAVTGVSGRRFWYHSALAREVGGGRSDGKPDGSWGSE